MLSRKHLPSKHMKHMHVLLASCMLHRSCKLTYMRVKTTKDYESRNEGKLN